MTIQIYIETLAEEAGVKGKKEVEIVDFNIRAFLLESFFIEPDTGEILANFKGSSYRVVYSEETYNKLYNELNG